MAHIQYNPVKRHLIFISNEGKPVHSLAGPIAEKTYKKISNHKNIES